MRSWAWRAATRSDVDLLFLLSSGDALGAGYEFGPALPDDFAVRMEGGGGFGWEPGEWTDDTSMAIPLLEVAARGERFDAAALDFVAQRWLEWSSTAKDVGNQTRAVLGAARRIGTGEALHEESRRFAATHPRSAGNGSLMRTAPVALAYLHDEPGLIEAARTVSELTHADPLAGDAPAVGGVQNIAELVAGQAVGAGVPGV